MLSARVEYRERRARKRNKPKLIFRLLTEEELKQQFFALCDRQVRAGLAAQLQYGEAIAGLIPLAMREPAKAPTWFFFQIVFFY